MKKLFSLILVTLLLNTAVANDEKSADINRIKTKVALATPLVLGTPVWAVLASDPTLGGIASNFGTVDTIITGTANFTGVALAAVGGYLIGSIIVDVDKAYFKGAYISKLGDFLGPVNRRIYNLTHDDELPEFIQTKDGNFQIINAGSRH
ncbi:MAG: hypothetical protein Q7U04_02125 [Bacteriovorax sp.]|nr:hypothetical protein [Bacteriovorax sp.]